MPVPPSPRTRVISPATRLPTTFDTSSPRLLALRARFAQFVQFGLVGGVAFVVDIGVYNLLRLTILDDKPIGAKVISVAVATIVAWIGNRHLTFRAERSRPVLREAFLFAVMNVIGLGIAAACLYVSHYVLGFQSQLADNIAGNVVGLLLGMAFRYFAYRYVVFQQAPDGVRSSDAPSDPARPTATRPAPAHRARRADGAAVTTPTTRSIPLPGPS